MGQSLHSLGVHIIFSTKGRAPLLSAEIRPRVHAYLATALQTLGCKGINVGGVEDHVHILCLFTKTHSTTDMIKVIKQDSSKFAKTLNASMFDFHWQSGYGLFGVSPSLFDVVREYVHRQEDHHRKESFQEEFRRLLIEARVDFDERYVWD